MSPVTAACAASADVEVAAMLHVTACIQPGDLRNLAIDGPFGHWLNSDTASQYRVPR